MRVITPEAQASYPHLFTPQPVSEEDRKKGKEPKYTVSLVFPPDSDLKELKAAAVKLAQEKWAKELAGAKLVTLDTQHGEATFIRGKSKVAVRMPWRDQDSVMESKGYETGSTIVNASTTRKPGIVSIYPGPDGKPAPITDEADVYPGVFLRASVTLYTYDSNGNKGVGVGLNNAQVTRDGPRLDGGAAAHDEFEADANAVASLDDLEEPVVSEEEDDVVAEDTDDAEDPLAALM